MVQYCLVRGCSSSWFPGSDLRFHKFPKNSAQRQLWLSAVPLKRNFYESARICSLHFKESDYDHIAKRLKPTTVPTIFTNQEAGSPSKIESPSHEDYVDQNSLYEDSVDQGSIHEVSMDQVVVLPVQSTCSGTYQIYASLKEIGVKQVGCNEENQTSKNRKHLQNITNLNELQACRICLVMDAKLVSMRIHQLEQAYENLTGISLTEEDKLPQKLCMECVQRLLNCSRFRHKSLRANSLMLEVIRKHDCLTVQNIKKINRLNNQLTSSLSTKHFEVNHYDCYFEYEDKQPILIQEDSPTTATVDIEGENEIVLTEETPDKNDGLDAAEVNDPGIDDDGITDTDVLNENDDDSDKEYVLSDKNNYSSGDSLQLQKCNTKKASKRKEKDDKPVKAVKRAKKVKDPAEPMLETLFTKTVLTFEEQIAEIVKRQESWNYKNAVYKCTTCFKGFLDEDAYNSHMSRHSNQCGEHECKVCKTHFKHRNALRYHVTKFHTQRFSCKQCPYVTTNGRSVRLHERWHKGEKYTCPHCQDEFVKFSTYMGHIRIKHPSDFVCGLCGYSFVSAKGLEQHKKIKHRLDNVQIPEDGPLCELCNVRFISSEAHKRHLGISPRHNIGTDKRSREPNTPKTAKNSNEYIGEGAIHCEQCGLQLKSFREYHGHFRRMHSEKKRTNYPSMNAPCMCEVCGKIFQRYANLRDHTRVHTGERPYKCDTCGKSFRKKPSLLNHIQIHSEVRASYECAICGKHFSNKSNRQWHMRIHTGLKPFKCEICGKAFKSGAEKRAHITYVHLKKPWPKRARGKRRPAAKQDQLSPQDQDMDSQASMSPTCNAKDEDTEMETVDMSQASMSPTFVDKDEDTEIETVDISPMIEDKSFIYILTVD